MTLRGVPGLMLPLFSVYLRHGRAVGLNSSHLFYTADSIFLKDFILPYAFPVALRGNASIPDAGKLIFMINIFTISLPCLLLPLDFILKHI